MKTPTPTPTRPLLVLALATTLAAACGGAGSSGGNGGSGGSTTGTGGHPSGGSTDSTGGASGGDTGGGGTAAGGSTGGSGSPGGGSSGSSGGGSSGGGASGGGASGGGATGTAGAGGATGQGGASGATGAGGGGTAMFSDDFEEYKIQGAFTCPSNPPTLCDFVPMGSTTPTWLSYHFHGPPYVVAANVFGGKQVYQLDHETGHPVATDIIKEAPDGTDLWPAAHYGRFMINLKSLPVTGSVGIMTESGLLPGSTTDTAQYTLGATDGKLSFSYMQRKRPFKNDVSTPTKRIGGNWENATEAPTTYCTVTATTATIAAGKWVCVEWMVDRTKPELHVWIDGAASLDVTGGGGTCSAGTAPTWTGPAHFTELDLGWEINDNDAGGLPVQFDMFAIGTQKLGCPAM